MNNRSVKVQIDSFCLKKLLNDMAYILRYGKSPPVSESGNYDLFVYIKCSVINLF